MKKIGLFFLAACLVFSLTLTTYADATFVLDFEKPELIGYKTICFNDGLNDKISIAAQDGFSGNAYKVSILEPEAGNTWWVTGMAIDKNASSEENFKNLENVTLKYKSTVEYINTPFIVQLVWKTKDKGEEITKIQVNFPVEKGEIKEFKIDVPADVKSKLDTTTNYYLDWVMIGLSDKAGEDFKPGTFIVDDISFNQAAPKADTVTTTETKTETTNNPKTGDSSVILLSCLALSSFGAMTSLRLGRKNSK